MDRQAWSWQLICSSIPIATFVCHVLVYACKIARLDPPLQGTEYVAPSPAIVVYDMVSTSSVQAF